MVHCHTVHLPLGALLTWCTVCGTDKKKPAAGRKAKSKARPKGAEKKEVRARKEVSK